MNNNGFIYKLFVGETNEWLPQFVRYIFVGGLAFLVDYGLLICLTEFAGFHYLVSATISFICGLVTNYLLSTKWIFRHSKLSNKMLEFTIFSIIGVVGLLLNNLLLYVFTDLLHVHYAISKLITAALVMVWNFVGRKVILFKDKVEDKSEN